MQGEVGQQIVDAGIKALGKHHVLGLAAGYPELAVNLLDQADLALLWNNYFPSRYPTARQFVDLDHDVFLIS